MSALSVAPAFTPDPEAVDSALVPTRQLAGGARIPSIGLGTFGSDHVTGEAVAAAVLGAAAVGYRHFDCAAVYANEALVGESLTAIQRGGVPRDQLWVTSKLWNDRHARVDVAPSCEKSLRDLQLDELDLYLVHWPFPNFHPPGCDSSARSPESKPYAHERFMETWGELERLVERGLVRHVGTSNMTVPKLTNLLRDARVRPVCNQMELHPYFQQPELFNFLTAEGIVPVGYCPLGSPARPERDRSPGDLVDLEDPVVTAVARAHGVHPSVVCLKWAIQRGQVPIPFSAQRSHYLANLRATVTPPLTAEEMNALAGVDRNCRLIKGHVFLWEGARGWEDLWDVAVTP